MLCRSCKETESLAPAIEVPRGRASAACMNHHSGRGTGLCAKRRAPARTQEASHRRSLPSRGPDQGSWPESLVSTEVRRPRAPSGAACKVARRRGSEKQRPGESGHGAREKGGTPASTSALPPGRVSLADQQVAESNKRETTSARTSGTKYARADRVLAARLGAFGRELDCVSGREGALNRGGSPRMVPLVERTPGAYRA